MSKTEHTPGPWSANWTRISGQAVGFHITDAKHGSLRPICESYDKTRGMAPEEIEANARLIASAPKLLKRLDELCETVVALEKKIPLSALDVERLQNARAAITKATSNA